MSIQQKEKGFTIIEVVLVLAIAGLIFMMVFIALPALQRSQRDTQRKNDLNRALTQLTNFTSNNRGSLPASTSAAWETFSTNYLKSNSDTFTDPTGSDYTFSVVDSLYAMPTEFDSTNTKIYVTPGSTCKGEDLDINQGNRKVAMRMKLEGGGLACSNN